MKRAACLLALMLWLTNVCTAQQIENPIMFVTQFPIPGDFAAIGSVFGNHRADTEFVGRGGDLYIRYPDGALRNLTAEAGFGSVDVPGETVFQGAGSIAVRDPVVHWSGEKAMFAMVVGAPARIFERPTLRWQIYEVTGLGRSATASITKVANQPVDYNNIEPAYASNDDVIFSSDRPRDGGDHLYPQLDEYESREIPTGLWKLRPSTGELMLLQHAPSGSFTPIVDSFGRVVFTRWDHLQRDQQSDVNNPTTFDYSSEAAGSVPTLLRHEVFPVPRNPVAGSGFLGHSFNHMFPWQINQDGTEEETLNHLGRHEFLDYFRRSMDDPSLEEFEPGARTNTKPINFMLQIREDPGHPGTYLAIDAREFEDHASGQLIRLHAPPEKNASDIEIEYLTSRLTYCCHQEVPENTGHYRNPLPMSNGAIVVSHTAYRGKATNTGSRTAPQTPFDFRLKRLSQSGPYFAPVETLTPGAGIVRSVSYFDPDQLVTYSGPFWELQAVEVVPRPVPPTTSTAVKPPEQAAFAIADVDVPAFEEYLRSNDLAVVVMRNVTARDAADKQQPFNLRVPGGASTVGDSGTVRDVTHMQFVQADMIRGGGGGTPGGRRALARYLHQDKAVELNTPFNSQGPEGAVDVFPDGSVAAYVPTRRAMAWQSLGPSGAPVVQERFWISFQPGEIRSCDGCHGINKTNQAGQPAATSTAQAFVALLARWKQHESMAIFGDGFDAP